MLDDKWPDQTEVTISACRMSQWTSEHPLNGALIIFVLSSSVNSHVDDEAPGIQSLWLTNNRLCNGQSSNEVEASFTKEVLLTSTGGACPLICLHLQWSVWRRWTPLDRQAHRQPLMAFRQLTQSDESIGTVRVKSVWSMDLLLLVCHC